jgi:ribosomal small subunit protein bTHX
MGKGDKKTKRGKIFKGSFGVRRPIKKKKTFKLIKTNVCVYYGKPMLKKREALRIEKELKKYPDNGMTKDHVPQKCLFDEYPPEFKNQRFTVPSCHKCNFEFSQVEHELRDLIGIANEKDDKQKGITKSSVKSILDKPNSESILRKDSQGLVRGVEFDLDKLLLSHVKNFKGVFYKTFGKIFPDNFDIYVLDNKQPNNFEELVIDFFNKNCKWIHSGHPDIFKYKISIIKPDKGGLLVKSDNINDSVGVICQLVYHKRFTMTVFANKKGIVKKKIS